MALRNHKPASKSLAEVLLTIGLATSPLWVIGLTTLALSTLY